MVTEQQFSELRKRVTHLEGQVAFLYSHLGMTFVPEPQLNDDPRIVEALKSGNLLQAIKIHRENTGETVEDASKAVEEMQGRLGL